MVGRFYGMLLLSAKHVQDLLADEKTLYARRFGERFEVSIVPFGAMVGYFPISAKDQSRLHQFGKKVLPEIFTGYALVAGRIWKGDFLVADIEELGKLDTSEIHARFGEPFKRPSHSVWRYG